MERTHRKAISFVGVAAAILLLSLASPSAAKCKTAEGGFTSDFIPPPTCTSGPGICLVATLDGDLAGTYYMTMDTLSCGGDPEEPSRCTYTGRDLVTAAHGATLFGQDTGVLVYNGASAPSPFETTVEITGGTRRYQSTSGEIIFNGSVDFLTGDGSGEYTATICNGGNR